MIPRPVARLLARGKPLVPDSAWPLLHVLRSARGDGPLVGLPAFRRVLVLAAHPDDEAIGCAGTMALLAARGARVVVLYATDGEGTRGATTDPGETGRRRAAEARAACRLLGVGDVRSLGRADGGLPRVGEELVEEVQAVVDEVVPDLVLLPWFLDGHPDHATVADVLRRVRLPAGAEVWGYETWTPLPANRIVDISSVVERKQRALAAHETAHLAFDVSAMLGLSRWRSVHGLMGRGHAEGFLAVPAERYEELAVQVTS